MYSKRKQGRGTTMADYPKAMESADKAKKFPASTQFAIVTALPNIINGASWGFTSIENAVEHTEAFKTDRNIIARKLGNACLVEVNPDYLIKAVNAIDPTLIRKEDIECMRKGSMTAIASFEKYLYTKGASKAGANYVGIYCVNDTPSIIYKEIQYPAFRINMRTFLELCAKWGYEIGTSNGKFITAAQADQLGASMFSNFILSPTNTGVFASIRGTYSADQIEAIKKSTIKPKG